MNAIGEVGNRLAVGEIAGLGNHGHRQMLLYQPDNEFRLLLRQAEAGTELAGDAGAGDRMVFLAALGDVVEKDCDIKRLPVFDPRHQLVGERMQVVGLALVDFREHVDGTDQMLIHCIVVVHVELHHRDDLAEFRNEAAKYACFVHAAQNERRVALGGEDRHEEAVRLVVFAQVVVDEVERSGDPLQSIGMELEAIDIGNVEEANDADGIVLEHVRAGERDATAILHEFRTAGDLAAAMGKTADRPGEPRRRFCLLVFESRAQDARQVADVLCHQEVVLHETLA